MSIKALSATKETAIKGVRRPQSQHFSQVARTQLIHSLSSSSSPSAICARSGFFGLISPVSMSYTISYPWVTVLAWLAALGGPAVWPVVVAVLPALLLSYGLYLSTLPTQIVFPSSLKVNLPIYWMTSNFSSETGPLVWIRQIIFVWLLTNYGFYFSVTSPRSFFSQALTISLRMTSSW
mgnify:CR=1 FL=1